MNGELKGATTDFIQPAKTLSIGTVCGGSTSHIDTSAFALEDFRCYNAALSAAEVKALAARFTPWPNGALVWGGGATGIWNTADAKWLSWSTGFADSDGGDLAYWYPITNAFTTGSSVLFDVPMTSLDAAAGISAGAVRFENDAVLAFGASTAVQCTSVSIPSGYAVAPATSRCIKPGEVLFTGLADRTKATFPTTTDGYGNAWYLRGKRLLYGVKVNGLLVNIH